MKYKSVYKKWKNDPISFWSNIANDIIWDRFPETILNEIDNNFYQWFPDGKMNTCFNAVDRNVEEGKGDQVAIYYDSPITNSKKQITYNELLEKVSLFAGALKNQNISKGDRIIIYMPMVPEAIIAMLAVARLGAVHSVVFGGFAAKELAVRIDDCKPSLIISASCGFEPNKVVEYKPLLDEAIKIAKHKVKKCIILQRESFKVELNDQIDIEWNEFLINAKKTKPESVSGNDPLYILYTSGTTGQPKGVVRDNGGHAVSLKWSMKNIYGMEPGEVFWAGSDIGWVVGHSYIVYAPLFHGCSTVLYEGKPVGTPDAGAFWRIINEYNVKVFFTAPTALRAVKREDPKGKFIKKDRISNLKALFLAGERADPDTVLWLEEKLSIPIIDHWWQTETGWPIASNPIGIENMLIKRGSPTVAMPGYEIKILDLQGNEVKRNNLGAICIKLPLPPSCLPTLWNANERYINSYLKNYPGFYETGDAGYMDEDDYIYVMSRTDDVINTAGHRLSTGAMEEVISNHPDVAECAVIGVHDDLKGQIPIGFACLNTGCNRLHNEICNEIIQLVRNDIGPVASFKYIALVNSLPKTRSGKILRSTIRKIVDGEEWTMPATIENPDVINEIIEVIKENKI